jgi:hypothetical protein
MFPIFIPSKGRSKTSLTLKALRASPFSPNYYAVVEPDEKEQYAEVLPPSKIVVLPESDRGLAYSRQYVLDLMIKGNTDWFWMLDDDLTGFYLKDSSGKLQKVSIDVALTEAEKYFSNSGDIAQAGLEYQQFAWSQNKSYALNSYCDCCVAIHTQRVKSVKFRDEVNLKLDRDFTLQVLSLGYKTLRTFNVAFSCPKNGSNAGGLQEVYKTAGEELKNSKRMCEIWGRDICKLNIKKDGRPDVSINWRFFKAN